MELILTIIAIGALLGFLFSKSGHEGEGAIQGAKTSCGCIVVVFIIIIVIFAILTSK